MLCCYHHIYFACCSVLVKILILIHLVCNCVEAPVVLSVLVNLIVSLRSLDVIAARL